MTTANSALPSLTITLALADRSDVLLVNSQPRLGLYASLKARVTKEREIDLGFLVGNELTKPIHRIPVRLVERLGFSGAEPLPTISFETTFSTFDGRNAVALLLARGGWVKQHR